MSFLVAFAALLLTRSADCYSSGPPTSVCRSLTPDPTSSGHNAYPLSSDIPFALTVVDSPLNTYHEGQTIILGLSSPVMKSFVGFLVQGRDPEGNPVGSFSPQNEFQQLIYCPGVLGNSIAQYNTIDQSFSSQEFIWTAIGTETNNVTFFYTVVHEMDEYWANHEGLTLHYSSSGVIPSLSSFMFLLMLAFL